MFNFVKTSKLFAIITAAVIAVGTAMFFIMGGFNMVGSVRDYDINGVIIAVALCLVCGFAYALVRFKKTLGVKAAVLAAISPALAPLFYGALVAISRVSLSTEPEAGFVFVSSASLIFTLVCFEVVLAGKIVGSQTPFSADAVNTSVLKLVKLVLIPALAVIVAAVILGIVMLIKANAVAMSAMFALCFAIVAVIFIPLFVIAPFAAKK